MLAVIAQAKRRFGDLPVALAGFSFGAYVQTRVAQALADAGHPAQRLVLVGTAAGHVEGARQYAAKAVAADTIVIHGAQDTTVPLVQRAGLGRTARSAGNRDRPAPTTSFTGGCI